MKVTIDRYRVLHLFILVGCSFILAETLVSKWGWSYMSAYGFAISITTQISNAINKDNPRITDNDGPTDAAEKKREEKRERIIDKRKERKSGALTGSKKRK